MGSTCYIKKGLKTKTSCFYSYILCYSVKGYSLFIYLLIYLFISLFNDLFIYLFIYLFTYLFIYLFIYLFTYLFIYLSIVDYITIKN